jgi:hypothetical protein
VPGHRHRAGVDLDPRDDRRVGQRADHRPAVARALTACLIVEDRAVNALRERGRRHDHLPVAAPAFGILVDARGGEPAITGAVALVHREDPTLAREQCMRGVDQRLCRHLVVPHCQLRISGMSRPCLSM